jgi:hypothetical protein
MRSMASVLNLKSKYLDFSVHRELFGVRGCGLVLTFLGSGLIKATLSRASDFGRDFGWPRLRGGGTWHAFYMAFVWKQYVTFPNLKKLL